MADYAKIFSKLFIGAIGIAFGATLIKEGINAAKEVQEYVPSENSYAD